MTQRSGDYGYVTVTDLYMSESGWTFLSIGEVAPKGTQVYLNGGWVDLMDSCVGQTVPPNAFPCRRPVVAAQASSKPQWSCRAPGVGHKREDGDLHCPICSKLYFRFIST